MEAGWNILWNMTGKMYYRILVGETNLTYADECPENCVKFCASSGIEVTMACYQVWLGLK